MPGLDFAAGWRVCRNCPQSPDELARLDGPADRLSVTAIDRALQIDMEGIDYLYRSGQVSEQWARGAGIAVGELHALRRLRAEFPGFTVTHSDSYWRGIPRPELGAGDLIIAARDPGELRDRMRDVLARLPRTAPSWARAARVRRDVCRLSADQLLDIMLRLGADHPDLVEPALGVTR